MEISKKLKLLREEHKLTQDELALKLNLSRSTISNYENGTRTPDINVLYEICEFYNITLDSLFKEHNVYKKNKRRINSKQLIIILTLVIAFIVVLSIVTYNTMYPKYNYGYDISDDELKVENCSEISIVKVIETIDDTHKVDIIHNFKGKRFEYIDIKNKSINVECSSYYLIFGNRIKSNNENRNYLSLDCLEIYDNRFIYELKDYDSSLKFNNQKDRSKTIIDYYTYFIDNSKKENIINSSLNNIREEEYIINNKNVFKNNYDKFNLINDLTYKFPILNISEYKYMDIDISMCINDNTNTNQVVSLFNSLDNNDISRIAEYKFTYNHYSSYTFNKITIHFRNISTDQFKTIDNNYEIIVRYGYDSIFGSSWTNSKLDIKVGFKN